MSLDNITWEYFHEEWRSMAPAAQSRIEDCFGEFQVRSSRSISAYPVSIGGLDYEINFNQMSQRNIKTDKQRDIRRRIIDDQKAQLKREKDELETRLSHLQDTNVRITNKSEELKAECESLRQQSEHYLLLNQKLHMKNHELEQQLLALNPEASKIADFERCVSAAQGKVANARIQLRSQVISRDIFDFYDSDAITLEAARRKLKEPIPLNALKRPSFPKRWRMVSAGVMALLAISATLSIALLVLCVACCVASCSYWALCEARRTYIDELQRDVELKASLLEMRQQAAAEAVSKAESQRDLAVQSMWAMWADFRPNLASVDTVDLRSRVQALLRKTAHDGDGSCNSMLNASVTHVQPVVNIGLWRDYCRTTESMREWHCRVGAKHRLLSPPITDHLRAAFPEAELDSLVGEQLLFHGTSCEDEISRYGFDERCAKNGLYGAGVYFTEMSCKSMQYAGGLDQGSNEGCIILARVALGDFYLPADDEDMSKERRPPKRSPGCQQEERGFHDSVIINPGLSRRGGYQVHREFVIYNGKQAYPELIIYFTV